MTTNDLENGSPIEMNAFIEYCESGCFIDYDGFGYLMPSDTEVEKKEKSIVFPSNLEKAKFRKKLKNYWGVLWFNR